MPLPALAPAPAGPPLQAPAPRDAELVARARRGDGLAFELRRFSAAREWALVPRMRVPHDIGCSIVKAPRMSPTANLVARSAG